MPGELVEIEKASFVLCCSRQNIYSEWIGQAIECRILAGMILNVPEISFVEVFYDSDWIMTDKEKKVMYKTYILGKIVKLDERCFGSKI